MFSPVLVRVELDRFWVNPGDAAFAMYTFVSNGPSEVVLEVDARLRPDAGGDDIECGFAPCLQTVQWFEGARVREGLFPIRVPEDAEHGEYTLLVALRDLRDGRLITLSNRLEQLDGPYCRACKLDVKPPRWVGRREPVTYDLLPRTGRRAVPLCPIVLRSAELEVVLDSFDALPYCFRLTSGPQMAGEARGDEVTVAVRRLDPRAGVSNRLRPASAKSDPNRAAFRFGADCLGVPAAEFSLVYALDGSALSVTLEDVRELDGYQLEQVELPGLVSVGTSDRGAWIAYAEDGGQIAQLSAARAGRLRATTEWRFSAPVAMVGTPDSIAALEVRSYLDTTELTVAADGDRKIAWLGTSKVRFTPGGLNTPSLRVEQPSLCRLHVLAGGSWLDAAKKLRETMPSIVTRYYDDRSTYKVFCQCGGSAPVTTFKQAAAIIRGFAALTDYLPQSVYLVGWQYAGHDTGYPAVDVVNPKIGGEEGLQELIRSAAEVNCTVSFHDNYDDAYRDSPAWDESIIARTPDGELMKGGWWAGGQSWIIGMADYARSTGWNRAIETCRRYGIRDTYHIDVLSAEALRSDWNPSHPASAYANLMGKYRIIDAFASEGVDVTTEGVSWPFIGKVSWFWAFQQARCDRFGGEEPIPLVQALFRHSARWGGGVGTGEGTLGSFFGGCGFGMELTADPAALERAVDAFYIVHVPWFLLNDRPLESYSSGDGVCTLGYGPGTFVRLDWRGGGYSVTVDGSEVARDHSTFCPLGDDRLAFYSLEPRELRALLPHGWQPAGLTARALHADREPEWFPFEVDEGYVRVNVPPRRPVILYGRPEPAYTEVHR